ncbi:unnamed protein product [Polarella glacialis]|uniref:Uncharacterized protein n=1 Tax=Polarella glacialis TaxID=89957 RepID=A0A813HFA8_POLGL|nr:unnamed protein product [Polarella glacialis]
MPLAPRELKRTKLARSGPGGYSKLVLNGEQAAFAAIPILRKSDGILLCVPGSVDLAAVRAQFNGVEEVVRGGHTCEIVDPLDSENVIELAFLDCGPAIHSHLWRIADFEDEVLLFSSQVVGDIWPDGAAVRAAAVQWLQNEGHGFVTADESEAPPPPKRAPKASNGSGGGSSSTSNKELLEAFEGMLNQRFSPLEARLAKIEQKPPLPVQDDDAESERVGALKYGRAKALAGRPPVRFSDEAPSSSKGKRQEKPEGLFGEEGDQEVLEDSSTDDLFKMALLKMLQSTGGANKCKKKKKTNPGLTDFEDGSDEEEEGGPKMSSLAGAKGVENADKLRHAMRTNQEAFIERMEGRMAEAVGVEEVTSKTPFAYINRLAMGKQRSLGFMTHLLASIHSAHIKGNPRSARLLVLQGIAAIEMYLLEEDWTAAWRLTHLEQPPWANWSALDAAAVRREHVRPRITDPVWLSAYLADLKERILARVAARARTSRR